MIEDRKAQHIEICLRKNVQAKSVTTGFEEVHLVHRALPEMDYGEIDIRTKLFGHELSAPLIISGMTGGTNVAFKINATLAEAAEKLRIGIGVGSQRVAIENPKLAYTFKVVREKAPTSFIIANIGGLQIKEDGVEVAKKAVDMIKADALAIHLNPLQETVQSEGQRDFRGILRNIKEIAQSISVPVIAKETGAGISAEDAVALEKAGVKGIDVSGSGGTSWSAVEYHRAKMMGDIVGERLGFTFWDWGIPTTVSLIEVRRSTKLTVIASGGIRDGIDVAKAMALDADAVGIAHPLLKLAMKGARAIIDELHHLVNQLRVAMFLTGSMSIKDLRKVPVVITGKTADWLEARGFSVSEYARRGL